MITELTTPQIKHAAKVFAAAFHDDPQAVYLVPDREERKRKLPYIFELAISYGVMYGKGYAISSSLDGIAIWLPPETPVFSLKKLIKSGFMSFLRKAGFRLAVRLMGFVFYALAVQKDWDSSRHAHLFLIAVHPSHQRKGYAKTLIQDMLGRLDKDAIPCYLETYNSDNIPLYQKCGFEVIHSARVPRTELNLWTMARRIPVN